MTSTSSEVLSMEKSSLDNLPKIFCLQGQENIFSHICTVFCEVIF